MIRVTDNDSVGRYLEEIANHPPLSAEEEIETVRKAQAGDEKAREKMILHNLRFVISIAKKYQGRGMPLMDLINEGNKGLIKSVDRFDVTRGFKFISYAVWWIKQSITSAFDNHARTVRLPGNVYDLSRKIHNASEDFVLDHGYKPTHAELSEILGIPEDRVKQIQGKVASYDLYLEDELKGSSYSEPNQLKDLLVAENDDVDEVLMKEDLRSVIKEALETLNDKERIVLTRFYGLDGQQPQTLADIGDELNLTRERVRQIRDKAILGKLRHPSRSKKLRRFYNGVPDPAEKPFVPRSTLKKDDTLVLV